MGYILQFKKLCPMPEEIKKPNAVLIPEETPNFE
jgi:hypothetical protein